VTKELIEPGTDPVTSNSCFSVLIEYIFKFEGEKTPLEIEEIICQYFLKKVEEETPKWMFNEFDCLFILGAKVSNKTIQKYLDKLIQSEEQDIFIHTLKRCCFVLLNNWKTIRNYQYCEKLIVFLNGIKNNVVIPKEEIDKIRIKWIIKFLKSDDFEAMRNFALAGSPNYAKHIQSVPSSQIKTNVNNTEYVQYLSNKYNATLIANYSLKAEEFKQNSLGNTYSQVKNDLYNYLFDDLETTEILDLVKEKIYLEINNYYEDEPEKIWDNNLALRTFNKILDKITINKDKSPASVFMCLITQGNLPIWINLLIRIVLVIPDCNKYLDHCLTSLIEYYRQSSTFDFEWLINMLSSIKRYTTVEVYRIHKQVMKKH